LFEKPDHRVLRGQRRKRAKAFVAPGNGNLISLGIVLPEQDASPLDFYRVDDRVHELLQQLIKFKDADQDLRGLLDGLAVLVFLAEVAAVHGLVHPIPERAKNCHHQ